MITLKKAREEDRLDEFIEQEEENREPAKTSIFHRLLDAMVGKKRSEEDRT